MKRKVTLSLAMTLLAFSSLVTASISFAWILTSYPFNNIDNKPGQIDGVATSKVWNIKSSQTNKWEDFSVSNVPEHNMGRMERIDVLPDNHMSYYMFNFTETSDALTNYFLMMEEIEIIVESTYDPDLGIYLEDAVVLDLDGISYYDSDPDQAAYYFKAVRSTNNTLDPTALFASAVGAQIDSENQIISPTDLAPNEYLYVMFYLDLEEVQNIIDVVPLIYSPYSLGFEFNFNIEKRTINE